MTNDKTALIKKVTEYKALDAILKLAIVPALIATVMALAGWMWNTSIKIVAIQKEMNQEISQWESIKENADDMVEVRIRLGILEYVSGIDSHAEREGGREAFDLKDMFRKVDEEMKNRKNEGVDNWKMIQQYGK